MATFFDKQSGKAELTSEEIEQLQKQLKEKTEEIRVIYNKLTEAGVVPLPDDFLDSVAGGVVIQTVPPSVGYTPQIVHTGDPRP